MFQKVQEAYERLQAGAAGGQGPQQWRLLLVLRAQVILYRRCGQELAPYKWVGLPLMRSYSKGGSLHGPLRYWVPSGQGN